MKKVFLVVLTVLLFCGISFPQVQLTGDLKTDAKIAFSNTNFTTPQFYWSPQSKKSPILAGVFSLVVPGAGEIYSGEYLKAGIFLALEAALITTAVIYDKKGDNKTNEFEDYADERWSVVEYAKWMMEHKGVSIQLNEDPSLQPWEQIVNWDELNAAEESIQGFSHKIPPHGEQQYYEMIGKYYQFSSGWDDYSGGANNYLISPHYSFYANMRGDANSFYNVASKAVIGIYVNHFLSALDAVWSAVSFNKNLAVNIRTENVRFADIDELVPVVNLKYSF